MSDEQMIHAAPTDSGSDTMEWLDVPVEGSMQLLPDPRVMKALGLNHALESAIADLVDNSIDARARAVLIRFVRRGPALVGLCVVDDGDGMDAATIDNAMRVGGSRDYDAGSLGHFGLGLKAASLGQARALTVVSRRDGVAVGRRWTLAKASDGFECDIVSDEFADAVMETDWGVLETGKGTVVRWDEVKAFPSSRKPELIESFLSKTSLALRHHLGLVFHRLIESGRVRIFSDVFDVADGTAGPPFEVSPIDPFGYQKSGRPGYPKHLVAQINGVPVGLICHVWPGRSQVQSFRLPGADPEKRQGFFFYRNDRLLQAGGWNGTASMERENQLARVVVDVPDALPGVFGMNPEKTRVETTPTFAAAVEAALADDGTDWDTYLKDVFDTFKQSRKRNKNRRAVYPPGRGFAPQVRRAIERELDFVPHEEPVDIRWDDIPSDDFFEIDRQSRSVRLNKRYRWAVLGEGASSLNDAPLVKALMYLLVEPLFHGEFHGSREKDTISLLSAILGAAAQAELK